MKKLIYIALFALTGLSCQKQIEFDIPPVENEYVIDGKIETDGPPLVFITSTQGYFDPTTASDILGAFVHGADVTMTAGGVDYPLIEICTSTIPDSLLGQISQLTGIPEQNLQFFDYCVYTSLDSAAWGVNNTIYNLEAIIGTDTLTASTKIQNPVPLNSTWFQVAGSLDSLGFLWANITEPDTAGNAYRWFAQRLNTYKYDYDDYLDANGDVIPVMGTMKDPFPIAPLGSVYDDKFSNGMTYDYAMPRGEIGNLEGPDDEGPEEGYFKIGDTVLVKFTSITYDAFLYIRALENQAATGGSPFASPGNLPYNVNGGLGFWGGYGVYTDTVICQ